MRKLNLILTFSSLLFLVCCTSYKGFNEGSESGVYRHLKYLASDEFTGRYPGSEGDRLAGDYIDKVLGQLKLKAERQSFSFLMTVKRGDDNVFNLNNNNVSPLSYTPFGFSKDTMIVAHVVFAGYGLNVKADSFEWDDYKDINVKGKWVLALRGSPDIGKNSQFLEMGADDRDKAMLAADKGAAGIILVSGYSLSSPDDLVSVSGKQARVSLPAFHIKRSVADSMLKPAGETVQTFESSISKGLDFKSVDLSAIVSARSDIDNVSGTTFNHYALLEGSDPVLRNEYIVIGAHYDHLGNGGKGSSSRKPDTIAVHNGADDNASGVAAMLHIAGMLSGETFKLKRSVIFVAFGGEELGLLGSKYFVNHLPVDISKVDAMINLDMVGRLNERKGLQVGGTGTSSEADSLIAFANKTLGLKITNSKDGSGPSDHSSFYGKNKPVFFLTTGAHTDYHTPEDDVNRINIKGLEQISEFAAQLATAIDGVPGDLSFREAGPKETASPSVRFKVTLGFMPDFSDNDIEGVRVDQVSKGKAAERGGIKNGDIITAIDGMPVRNIYDYMYRLTKLSKNQIISVELLRDGKKEVLVMQL